MTHLAHGVFGHLAERSLGDALSHTTDDDLAAQAGKGSIGFPAPLAETDYGADMSCHSVHQGKDTKFREHAGKKRMKFIRH